MVHSRTGWIRHGTQQGWLDNTWYIAGLVGLDMVHSRAGWVRYGTQQGWLG